MSFMSRLSPFIMMGVGALALYGGYGMYSSEVRRHTERQEALQSGPPRIVEISQFDREKDTGPAKEVFVRAQLDLDINYELTRTKNGSVKDRAFLIALFPVAATSTDQPPVAILFETDDQMDDDGLFAKMVSEGPIGPIVELNGQLTGLGQLGDSVRGAFEEQNRAYVSGIPAIDPFQKERSVELASSGPRMTSTYIAGGLGGLLLLMGFLKLRRARAVDSRIAELEADLEARRRQQDP